MFDTFTVSDLQLYSTVKKNANECCRNSATFVFMQYCG